MRFVRFTEDNDNEHETWRLWIQFEGNEIELGKLKELLDSQDDELPYFLDLHDLQDERYVDVLVEEAHRSTTYYPSDRKVLGTLRCPTNEDLRDQGLTLDEVLYHSGLFDFVTASAAARGVPGGKA
jgi:hypothetical protein